MKKIILAILLCFATMSLANADSTNIGLKLSVGNFDASGSTTGVDNIKDTHTSNVDVPYASVFIERQVSFANLDLGFGVDYMPLAAELDTKTGTATKAKAKLNDQWSIYLQPTKKLDGGASVFAKVGYAYSKLKITDISHQQATTGSSALRSTTTSISDTLQGPMIGIGFEKDLSNGAFVRAEATYINYDTISATLSNSRKVSADSDLTSAHISIGKRF